MLMLVSVLEIRSTSVGKIRPIFGVLALVGFLAGVGTGCYEEDSSPYLEPSPVADNACFALGEKSPEELQSPDGLLAVFDCVNSEESFSALRSPLSYLVETTFVDAWTGGEVGYLDPYFMEGYLEPLNLDANVQNGDPLLMLESLNVLLNDPSDPLGAMLDLYLDVYDRGYVEQVLAIAGAYSQYLLTVCTTVDCPLMDIANDLYANDALVVLQENAENLAASIDPKLAADLQYDIQVILEQSASVNTTLGENLLFSLARTFAVDPLQDNPEKTVDDTYVSQEWTLLRALQQPLCQLRSDRDTLDAFSESSADSYLSGTLANMPYYLRTLVNYSPNDVLATTSASDTIDHDLDGYSIANGDCNDADLAVYPGAPEITNDLKDNDCNAVPDDPNSGDLRCDRNNDGYEDACGEASTKYDADCDRDCDGVSATRGDCNDTDATIHPRTKIYGSDGSIRVVQEAVEFPGEGDPDLKDNNCDGYTDYIPSSLQLVLKLGVETLPVTYEIYEGDDTNLTYMIETVATQDAVDLEALLTANEQLIDQTLFNLANGTISPELTALVRETFPVIEKLADMGLLSSASSSALFALYTDHDTYQEGLAEAEHVADSTGSMSLLTPYLQYDNACGEDFDAWVDTLKVLDEFMRIVDAYGLLEDPALVELIRVVVNSDFLDDYVKQYPYTVDENGDADPEVAAATLELFDYFLKPPSESSLYYYAYDASRIWTVAPMLQVIFNDPQNLDFVEALMLYVLDGMEDPASYISMLDESLASLETVETGATIDQDALTLALLSPDARYILLNGLALGADENIPSILFGRWEDLSPDTRSRYETEESTMDFVGRWIRDGVVTSLLDMAGNMLSMVLEYVDTEDESDESTGTPSPESGK